MTISSLIWISWLTTFLAFPMACLKAEYHIGICTHTTSAEGLNMIEKMGVPWTRNDLEWSKIELEKGRFIMPKIYEDYVNGCLQRNIQPLLILNYGNPFYNQGGRPETEESIAAYIRYAEFVVTHFKGRVHKYEVWNEWNAKVGVSKDLPRGEPEAYVRLLKAVYPRLKAIDPNLEIIGGVLSNTGLETGWLKKACDAGMLDHLDSFSFHPYTWDKKNDRTPEIGLIQLIRQVRELVDTYPRGPQVGFHITEIGWPNHQKPDGVSKNDSARYLARTVLLLQTLPYIKGVWWFTWVDNGLDPLYEEHNFGILQRDFTPKPAYFVLRNLMSRLKEVTSAELLPKNQQCRLVQLVRGENKKLYAVWAMNDITRYQVRVTVDAVTQPPPLTVLNTSHGEFTREWRRLEAGRWSLLLTLTQYPLFFDLTSHEFAQIEILENSQLN